MRFCIVHGGEEKIYGIVLDWGSESTYSYSSFFLISGISDTVG